MKLCPKCEQLIALSYCPECARIELLNKRIELEKLLQYSLYLLKRTIGPTLKEDIETFIQKDAVQSFLKEHSDETNE